MKSHGTGEMAAASSPVLQRALAQLAKNDAGNSTGAAVS